MATPIDDEETDAGRGDTFEEAMTYIEKISDTPQPKNMYYNAEQR